MNLQDSKSYRIYSFCCFYEGICLCSKWWIFEMANTWIKSTLVYCLTLFLVNWIQILLCCLWLLLIREFLIVLMNPGQYLTAHWRWARTVLEWAVVRIRSRLNVAMLPQDMNQWKWRVSSDSQRKPVSSLVFLWQMIHDCLWEDQLSHDGKEQGSGGRRWGFLRSRAQHK